MSDEKMTLDELETEIIRRLETGDKIRGLDSFMAVRGVLDYIRANRAALEAGMQKPLRFKIVFRKGTGDSRAPGCFQDHYRVCLTSEDGKECWCLRPINFRNKREAHLWIKRQVLESLGLTAEFVEEKE